MASITNSMKKVFLRTSALLLAVVFLLLGSVSCAGKPKTLMSMSKDGVKVSISANIYERMLSRMKGNLCFYEYTAGGFTADKAEFWKYTDKFDGVNVQTIDEYYRATILENCRTYLVALYLFEREGLTLSETALEEIEKAMFELIRADGDGSKTKLNSVLAAYGMNYNLLQEAYTIEAKVEALQTHLYGENASLIGQDIKTEYMKENYVHFRQVFLASYTYEYETDKNGDVIYYHVDGEKKGQVYYDSGNGIPDERTGEAVKDEKGNVIYYTDTNYDHIAYNEVRGEPVHKTNEDGSYKTTTMTTEELDALQARADTLFAELKDSTNAEFETAIEKESEDVGDSNNYDDGYYLQKNMDYTASGDDYLYLEEIVEKLKTMEIGDVALVSSKFGYHIVKKYEHSEKAYENEVNETWFQSFNSDLIQSMFLAECRKYFSEIKLDEAVLASVPSMKDVGINYYY